MGYTRKPNYHFRTQYDTGIDKVPDGRIVVIENYDGSGTTKTFIKPVLTNSQKEQIASEHGELSEISMQTFVEVAKVAEKEALSRETLLAAIDSGELQLSSKTQFLGIKMSTDRSQLLLDIIDQDDEDNTEVNPDDYLYWILDKDVSFKVNEKGKLLLSIGK